MSVIDLDSPVPVSGSRPPRFVIIAAVLLLLGTVPGEPVAPFDAVAACDRAASVGLTAVGVITLDARTGEVIQDVDCPS